MEQRIGRLVAEPVEQPRPAEDQTVRHLGSHIKVAKAYRAGPTSATGRQLLVRFTAYDRRFETELRVLLP
jgi:hypothetical protein